MTILARRYALVVSLVVACGHAASPPSASPARPAIAPAIVSTGVFDLPSGGNGVFWDAAHQTLYVTDSASNRIDAWSDAGTFTPVGAFVAPPPAANGKTSLGSLLRLSNGTFVSPSFGFGVAGGVNVLAGDGASATLIPNLDPAKRRIALAATPDGTIYETYFVAADHQHVGGVARLDVATGETEVITGLGKPVGIAATADALYVADQDTHTILVYRRAGSHPDGRPYAQPASCDQLTLLPNGDLVTGGKTGEVYRITAHDAPAVVTVIASGLAEIRGSAYDASHHRLFFIEHVKDARDRLHVMPLD